MRLVLGHGRAKKYSNSCWEIGGTNVHIDRRIDTTHLVIKPCWRSIKNRCGPVGLTAFRFHVLESLSRTDRAEGHLWENSFILFLDWILSSSISVLFSRCAWWMREKQPRGAFLPQTYVPKMEIWLEIDPITNSDHWLHHGPFVILTNTKLPLDKHKIINLKGATKNVAPCCRDVYRQLKKLSFDIYLTHGASKVRSLRKPRLQYCTEGCGIPSCWVWTSGKRLLWYAPGRGVLLPWPDSTPSLIGTTWGLPFVDWYSHKDYLATSDHFKR